MKRMLLPVTCAAALALAAPAAFAKGGDDGPGDDHGTDAPAQVTKNGADDPAGHDAGDDKSAKGNDDPAGHDAGDDKGGNRGRHVQTRKAKRARTAGTCTAGSESTLKANPPRNGRIEVEFEVESHVSGQIWRIRMDDNGATFFSGSKKTRAPGGSFEARAFAKNRAGTDRITASATNPATGETCTASISV